MMPNPSHPSSIVIIWGKNTKIFIDKTNSIRINKNRLIKMSFIIYVLENKETFAEINITIDENSSPHWSKIIGRVMLIEEESSIFQINR